MAPRRRSLAVVALIMFLGIVVGTAVGEAVGLLMPEGKVVRDVFVNSPRRDLSFSKKDSSSGKGEVKSGSEILI